MGGDCMSKMLLNRVVSVNTFQREFDLRCVELIQGTKNKGFLQKRQIFFLKICTDFYAFLFGFLSLRKCTDFFLKNERIWGKRRSF